MGNAGTNCEERGKKEGSAVGKAMEVRVEERQHWTWGEENNMGEKERRREERGDDGGQHWRME